jgi:DNA-binding transcriptional MerR regulator
MEAVSRIPQKLFFRIGEVCELIKVQPHVLRYWETEFPMLAPQKNRAGQRVYRRKDVEMVLRIRDLLYEEKFTIAGAKKKLLEETRGGSSRLKVTVREAPEPEEAIEAPDPAPDLSDVPQALSSDAPSSPEARLAINVLKRNLEDLLTMLNADASITR